MRKPLPGHLAFREAVKNKTNKNEKKKNSNLSITVFNAADRNRTGTGITTHGILSPGRLPVPPLRHSSKCFRILNDPEETRTLDLRRDRAAL